MVSTRGGAAEWERVLPRGEGSLESELRVVLAQLPGALPARIHVAAGLRYSQGKKLERLPPATEARLQALVAANVTRFFPSVSGAVSGGVRVVADGAWAASFDGGFVAEVSAACSAAGFTAVRLVPLSMAFGARHAGASVTLCDVGAMVSATFDSDGLVTSITRTLAEGVVCGSADALLLEAAFGAATMGRETAALTIRYPRRIPTWRGVAAAGALCVATTAVVVAPGFAARRERDAYAARVRAATEERVASARAAGELSRATLGVRELAAFDRHPPVLQLLARIASALPPGAALVALHVDSTTGTVVALAQRADDVVGAFDRLPGITGATVVGPVTPEEPPPGQTRAPAGAPSVERVTVRFEIVRQAGR